MIPKVIHYCWFGGAPLPQLVKECITSWRELCPDYKIVEWNENNFDVYSHPYMKEAMERKQYAFVSDYARLKIVYEQGGIYMDTDVKVLRSLDELLKFEGFAGFEKGWPCREGRRYEVATGLGFGAEAGNEIIGAMLKAYDGVRFLKPDGSQDRTPCPTRNMEALIPFGIRKNNTCQNVGGFQIFSSEYFCPMDYVTGKTKITKNTYTIHLYDRSWRGKKDAKKYFVAALRCSAPGLFFSRVASKLIKDRKNK